MELPQFYIRQITQSLYHSACTDYIEAKMQRYMALMVLPAIKTNGEIIRKVLFCHRRCDDGDAFSKIF